MFVGRHIVIPDAIKKHALPQNLAMLEPMLDAYNEAADGVTNEERVALINSAHGKNTDPPMRVALNGAHEIRVRLNIWADNIALLLFDIVELLADEWVQITNRQDHRYRVLQTAQHGDEPHEEWVEANNTSMFIPYLLSTGIIKYPSRDLVSGALTTLAEVETDASRMMDQEINTDLYTLISAGYWVYPSNTQVLDTRIVAGTRPTTSELSLTSEGSVTLEVMKSIIDHFIRLGLGVRTLIINPSEWRDTWDWQTVVSTTSTGSQDGRTIVTTRLKEGIEGTGGITSLYGQEFTWVLDPIRPLKIVEAFAGPAGTLFTKPAMDTFRHYDEDDMDKKDFGENYNGIKMIRAIKPLIYGQQPLNALRTTFDT